MFSARRPFLSPAPTPAAFRHGPLQNPERLFPHSLHEATSSKRTFIPLGLFDAQPSSKGFFCEIRVETFGDALFLTSGAPFFFKPGRGSFFPGMRLNLSRTPEYYKGFPFCRPLFFPEAFLLDSLFLLGTDLPRMFFSLWSFWLGLPVCDRNSVAPRASPNLFRLYPVEGAAWAPLSL